MQNKKLTALIVDDAYFSRDLIRRALADIDVKTVGEASSGMEALEMYQKYKPDIVTLEVKIHNNKGLDIMKSILSHDINANILVITSTYNIEEEALRLGAKTFLRKPFQPAYLWKRVRQMESMNCFEEKIEAEDIEDIVETTNYGDNIIDMTNVVEEDLLSDGSMSVEINHVIPNDIILEIVDTTDDGDIFEDEEIEEKILEDEVDIMGEKDIEVKTTDTIPTTKEETVSNIIEPMNIKPSIDDGKPVGIISIRPPRGYMEQESMRDKLLEENEKIEGITIVSANKEKSKPIVSVKKSFLNRVKDKLNI